jgi:hypothetical protein
MSDKDELAALKKKVEALEAKISPPQSTFVPESDAEHQNRVHQMRERRMALASNFHPDDLRAMDALTRTTKEIALRDARAPQGPGTSIPSSQSVSNVRTGGSATPGYVDSRPLSNPPGVNYADKLMDEQDRRDRAELAQKLGALGKR